MFRYAALVPVDDHAEAQVPRDFRPFGGLALWEHITATLHGIDAVDAIYINTCSERFTPEALRAYPKVQLVPRPEALSLSRVPSNLLVSHDLATIPKAIRFFLQTQTTNPLLRADTIETAIGRFETAFSAGHCDSLFSATAHRHRFYTTDLASVRNPSRDSELDHDAEPLLEENSNFYLFTRESFAATQDRIGKAPMAYEMSRWEALTIEDHASWRMAEVLLGAL